MNAQDQVLWDGQTVSMERLRQYLDITQQMNPVPELHLQPDATPATRRWTGARRYQASPRPKMGFVGNEYYMNIF